MIKNYIIGAIVFIALILMLIFVIIPTLRSGYQFRDTAINATPEILRDLVSSRTPLHVDNTNQAALLGVIGLVLVVDEADGKKPESRHFDRSSVIPDFRPDIETVSVVPLDTTRYQGKISNKFSFNSAYTSFTTNLSDDQTADVFIKDEMYLSFRDKSKIPYEKLRRLNRIDGKKYFFVEGATLSSTTYRTFKQVTSGATLDGTAFKADGKVFASSDTFAYQPTLSVEVFEITPLGPATGGATEDRIEILGLLEEHKAGKLNKNKAGKLLDLLKTTTKQDTTLVSGANIKLE